MKIVLLINNKVQRENWAANLHNTLLELGHDVHGLKPNLVTAQELYNYDLIISYGLNPKIPQNKDHIIADLGYIDRYSSKTNPKGHLQFCWKGLNNLVPEAPSDRNNVKLENFNPEGKTHYMILGQKEGDRQHGMGLTELKAYYDSCVSSILSKDPEAKILFRNHPFAQTKLAPKHTQEADSEPLDSYLDQVKELHTYNSTGALVFIMKGIPVVSSPKAFYHYLNENGSYLDGSREDFFNRLTYTQWNAEELKNHNIVTSILNMGYRFKPINGQEVELPSQPKEVFREVDHSIEVPELHLKKSPKKGITLPEDLYNTRNPPNFHADVASAILEESDYYIKVKLFKQIWPDRKEKSKKDIEAFCRSLVGK